MSEKENIELSETASLVSKLINQTDKNIYLTGKAGTGKTTLLKYIIKHTHKKAAIAAPTGIAAINAGGVTIHSLFQLPFGAFVPKLSGNSEFINGVKLNDLSTMTKFIRMSNSKRNLLRELELLIVDEVSMLRADLLDAMDTVLRSVRRKRYSPFGGLQVLFIGDLLQLPPVVKNYEWELLKAYHKSIYFFDARVLQNEKPVYMELDKIYRQGDPQFIDLLNNLRNNKIGTADIELLNKFYKPDHKISTDENYITLTTHNDKAFQINRACLSELKGNSQRFEAMVSGDFSESSYPVEKTLELKAGAQVMFIKNDPTGKQLFFNGKIGIVSKLNSETVEVKCEGSETPIKVELYTWENVKYNLNANNNEVEENVIGKFTHYPIKLAWAITVHKSQGLTFDKAIIDIAGAFAPGQIYVALSRLRSLNGLVLSSKVNFDSLKQDEKIEEFSRIKTEQEDPAGLMKKESVQFLKRYILDCFDLASLMYLLGDHVNSYAKDEKRSAKQKHQDWSNGLKDKVAELKTNADKFSNEVKQIFDHPADDVKVRAKERVEAAVHYFTPLFKKLSEDVLQQMKIVEEEKKIKTYLTELHEIELTFFEKIKQMTKAVALCRSACEGTEFGKNELNKLECFKEREQMTGFARQQNEAAEDGSQKKKKKSKRAKTNEVKKSKGATYEESYKLYKDGKTIEEIAALRELAVTTVEGHLSRYVSKGLIDAKLFVSEEKIKRIKETAKKLETGFLGPIKTALGDDFSYTEIRMAMAVEN